MTEPANALHSLYGGKVKRQRAAKGSKALAGNVGGQEREQTVLTPPWFVQQIVQHAGPIALDPCTTPANPTQAQFFCTQQTNGLIQPWHLAPGLFYCNPPFADLGEWLAKAREEWLLGARGYLLGPFRPHRTWFCDQVRGLPVQSLRSFPFVGEDSPFPAPLCVVSYGLPLIPWVDAKGRSLVTGVWHLEPVPA